MSETYDAVNNAWKSTCRVLLGDEIGELHMYEKWLLSGHFAPPKYMRSSISGKSVALFDPNTPQGGKIISYDEIDFGKKYPALKIGDIKDIDSIMQAVSDNAYFCGNKVFGISSQVEESDNVIDSHSVYSCHTIVKSKYAAYCSIARNDSEYIFGSDIFLRGKFLIRFHGGDNITRCFESGLSANSSDMFFCTYCHGCSNMMFSFNQRAKNYCIGNLQLGREKFISIRDSLLEQSRDYIMKNGKFFDVFSFAGENSEITPSAHPASATASNFDIRPVENAFASATSLLFGKKLFPISLYAAYLEKYSAMIYPTVTAFGSKIWASDYFWASRVPKGRAASAKEAAEAGERRIDGIAENPTLHEVIGKAKKIAFYPVDFFEGENSNFGETPTCYFANDAYRVSDCTYSKCSACSTHLQNCEASFGCSIINIGYSYCARCHTSNDLRRCFEVSNSANSSDCYFCHNVENCTDCMFCFNVKNKKYAIGNVEVGREKYLEVKQKILSQIADELEKTHSLKYDIYNIGCANQ